ncbi:MAG: S41 family peptidase [Tannerella sp.]|jgi:hypothetical protein|nr:S41 family peptidase [Tannerella sp.]
MKKIFTYKYLPTNKVVIIAIILLMCPFFCVGKTFNDWERKQLSEQEKANVQTLSKMYGYIRYFYPNDKIKNLDWYKFLIYSLNEIESCKSDDDFRKKLQELFSPICPQLLINQSKKPATASLIPSNSFYINEHRNEPAQISSEIKNLTGYDENYPIPDSLYTFVLNPTLTISFPIAVASLPLKSRELSKLISNVNKVNVRLYSTSTLTMMILHKGGLVFANSYKERVANEIIRCNIVQHFYPYYNEDGLDGVWNKTCKNHFEEVANCTDLTSFYFLICRLMNPVKDSHLAVGFDINFNIQHYSRAYYPELKAEIYGQKLYVKAVNDKYRQTIHKGDLITKINDYSADSLINEKLKYISYSTLGVGLVKLSANDMFKSYKRDSAILLTVKNFDGFEISDTVQINSLNPYFIEDSIFIKSLDDALYYVDLCNSKGSYDIFKSNISKLSSSKGIIFDLRGYPGQYAISVLANLLDTTVSLGNLNRPITYYPDHIKEAVLRPSEKWYIAPATSPDSDEFAKKNEYEPPVNMKLTGKFVFLMNSASISFCESLLDIIKHYGIGAIIGSNSAGCNGDATKITLPFASFTMTGLKFMNRDGSQHHGIGISPDIRVDNEDTSTDNQLEAAKKYIYEYLKTNP